MKRIIDWLSTGFFFVVITVAAILLGIVAVIFLPFDYIRYKTSRYYRDLKIKYKGFAGTTSEFYMYNVIKKVGLPLDYYYYTPPAEEDEEENPSYHWFVYKDILIPAEFLWNLGNWDKERGWFCGDSEECLGVTELLEENLQTFAQAHPEVVCTRAVALVKRKEVESHLLSVAEQDPTLILYDKRQWVIALLAFIENYSS